MKTTRRFGRGSLLFRLFALLAVVSLVAAACGDDSDDDGAGGDTTVPGGDNGDGGGDDDIDPEGVLYLSKDFTSWNNRVGFDPTAANAPGQWFNELLYGTPLVRTGDGTYHDGLASAAGTMVVDSSTIEVELQSGLTFTDGTPVTAQHLADVLARNALSGASRALRIGQLSALVTEGAINDGALEVTGDTSLTINLDEPIAGSFFDLLAHEESALYLIPEGVEDDPDTDEDEVSLAIQEDPIGAGPYMLEEGSFSENGSYTLVKNPDYVRADEIRVPNIVVNHVTADSSVNSLNSGGTDWSPSNITTASQVTRDGYSYRELLNEDLFGWLWIACMGPWQPGEPGSIPPRTTDDGEPHPLTDVRVRQALNYATDKEALIEQGLVGLDTDNIQVMDQIWPNDAPEANPDLVDSYPFDQDRARELLDEAGYGDGLTLTIAATPGNATVTGELLQQQWAQVGITLELTSTENTVTDFYVGRSIDMSGAVAGSSARFFTDKITRNWSEPSVGATCPPAREEVGGDPMFTELVRELEGLAPDDPAAVELWQDIAPYIIEPAFGVFFSYPPNVLIGNYDKIGAVGADGGLPEGDAMRPYLWPTQVGIFYLDPHQIYIRS